MVYCLQARLTFGTVARRDGFVADVQTEIAARGPKWGDVTVAPTVIPGSTSPAVVVEVRFTTQSDVQQAYTNAVARASARTALAGSVIEWHPCSHDEPDPQPCKAAARTVI